MLVDPETGMPIGPGPQASTMAGRMGLNGLEGMGFTENDLPLAWDMAASMPSAVSTSMWNMGRVSNTIVEGGTARGLGYHRSLPGLGRRTLGPSVGRGRGGFVRGGITQTFGPRHFGRLTRPANIDPGNSKIYSPFGFAANIGNFVERKINKGSTGPAFNRGTLGRMATMARINSMSGSSLVGSRVASSIMDMSPSAFGELTRHLGVNESRMVGASGGRGFDGRFAKHFVSGQEAMTANRAAHVKALGATFTGRISGQMAGYFAGAQEARMAAGSGIRTGMEALQTGSKAYMESAFRRGATTAATHYAGGEGISMAANSMAKVVGSRGASFAMRAAGPIGTALIVKDLATMGGKLIGHATRTMVDAGVGLMQPLNKGIMGATYKDNAVAATSRQRGVMAIQASRLNMRSVLGSEAASMHGHFG